MREMGLGLLASLFFAVTFILNRSMELEGGSWVWSASLRFLFMIPFLVLIVLLRRGFKQVFIEIAARPLPWLGWSFVGFVLFYAPLTYAAAFGPGWLVAGAWQITIVAGVLIAPFLSPSGRKAAIQDKWPVHFSFYLIRYRAYSSPVFFLHCLSGYAVYSSAYSGSGFCLSSWKPEDDGPLRWQT